MTPKGLIEALTSEAEAERDKILLQAHQDAERILSETSQEIKRLEDEQIERLERELAGKKLKAKSRATLKAMEIVLNAKQEALNQVFSQALARLMSLEETEKYPEVLEKLISESLKYFGEGACLWVNEKDLPLLSRIFKERFIDCEFKGTSELRGGVKVVSLDGKFSCLNTLSSRMERVRIAITGEIAKILWD